MGEMGTRGASDTGARGKMKEARDSVDSTVAFGLNPIYLCSNFW